STTGIKNRRNRQRFTFQGERQPRSPFLVGTTWKGCVTLTREFGNHGEHADKRLHPPQESPTNRLKWSMLPVNLKSSQRTLQPRIQSGLSALENNYDLSLEIKRNWEKP